MLVMVSDEVTVVTRLLSLKAEKCLPSQTGSASKSHVTPPCGGPGNA